MPAVTDETLLRYCLSLYHELERDAKPANGYKLLWEGKLVALFSSLSISNAHYRKVFDTMYEAGCIEMVRRGARNVPTQIALHGKPTGDNVKAVVSLDRGLTPPTDSAKLERRVKEIEGRLQGINVHQLVKNYNERMLALEAEVKRLNGKDT